MNEIIKTCICGKCDINSQEHKASEFLINSNLIEGERSVEAIEDAHLAWEYALKLKQIKVEHLLQIHKILMQRLNPGIAGKIRDCNVTVGGRFCPVPELLEPMLFEYIKHFNEKYRLGHHLDEPLGAWIKNNHVKFEVIHPFEDGNGRTGRILYNWQRLKYGLPIHVIKVGHEQQEYYKWFK